jgi:alpha-beta hydrolase superfamily lysophospholipase
VTKILTYHVVAGKKLGPDQLAGTGPARHPIRDQRRTSSVTPTLTVRPATGPARAVVLVLHGGKANSVTPTRPSQLSVLRMRPFATALQRAGAEVWLLRNRVRGWNGGEMSPVVDARWALQQIRDRHGDVPVSLVGHLMGGRAALRVADDPLVRGVVALAPWLPDGEPVEPVTGRRVVILHGTRDRWTDPNKSLAYARRAESLAAELRIVLIRGAGHPMLRRISLWHGLTSLFALEAVADRAVTPAEPNVLRAVREVRAPLVI